MSLGNNFMVIEYGSDCRRLKKESMNIFLYQKNPAQYP